MCMCLCVSECVCVCVCESMQYMSLCESHHSRLCRLTEQSLCICMCYNFHIPLLNLWPFILKSTWSQNWLFTFLNHIPGFIVSYSLVHVITKKKVIDNFGIFYQKVITCSLSNMTFLTRWISSLLGNATTVIQMGCNNNSNVQYVKVSMPYNLCFNILLLTF